MKVPIEKVYSDGDWAAPRDLVDSIRAVDQLLPLLVLDQNLTTLGYQVADGYQLVDGRRRLAAMKELGFDEVEVKVVSPVVGFALLGLAGNVHSSNPLSEARMIQAVRDDELVQQTTGMTKAMIRARRKLLNLSGRFQEMLETGELTLTAAKELARLPTERQIEAYETACLGDEKKPTVNRVRDAVRKIQGEVQPQLAVNLPVVCATNGIDPVAVAMSIRRVVSENGNELSCDEHDILMRAAEIIERL